MEESNTKIPPIVRKWLELRDRKMALQKELNEIQEELEKLKQQIAEEIFHRVPGVFPLELSEFAALNATGPCLRYRIITSHRLDEKALKEQYPKIYQTFLIQYQYDVLTIEFTGAK
jgi:Mlc titration factor MtfA (ptsG expression regulator)